MTGTSEQNAALAVYSDALRAWRKQPNSATGTWLVQSYAAFLEVYLQPSEKLPDAVERRQALSAKQRESVRNALLQRGADLAEFAA